MSLISVWIPLKFVLVERISANIRTKDSPSSLPTKPNSNSGEGGKPVVLTASLTLAATIYRKLALILFILSCGNRCRAWLLRTILLLLSNH